ncbi:MAG: redoxin domain-containing protein [Actinomycetia bacterium]|nr:redoxin domain-containing protein [Actinomycetes bacterium]
MPLAIGTPAPDFTLYDQNAVQVSLSDLAGHNSLIVFIPFPFTGHCDNEGCAIRDGLGGLESLDAKVVVITDHAVPVNAKWATENGFDFPVLSDFWPHGVTTQAYDAFNNMLGAANRVTYVLDADGIIRDVIATESLGIPREYELYGQALAAL